MLGTTEILGGMTHCWRQLKYWGSDSLLGATEILAASDSFGSIQKNCPESLHFVLEIRYFQDNFFHIDPKSCFKKMFSMNLRCFSCKIGYFGGDFSI